MRAATSALLGGLTVVAGWTAWATLTPPDAPPPFPPADSVAAAPVATPSPAPPPRLAPPVRVAAASTSVPSAAPTRPPALRPGLVLEHGMPTAVHALADDGAAATVPPVVALPAGARAEDATVNPAGMLAMTRSVAAPATQADATTDPARPSVAERAH